MRLQKSRSRTAESAALSRAVSARESDLADRNPDDLAEQMLGWGYRCLLRSRSLRQALIRLMDFVGPGMHLYHLARTRHFDALLLQELQAETKQVVILSAGLDSRAHRFAQEMRNVVVYEVDHPFTSAWKQQMVHKRLCHGNASVRYVPVDLALSDLLPALKDAGLRADQKTFFLWEGASVYLPPEAVRALLSTIAGHIPKSSIAFDYMYRSMLQNPEQYPGGVRHRKMVRWVGEPYLFGCDPQDIWAFCASHGFEVLSNCDAETLATRHLAQTRNPVPEPMAKYFGIVHARPLKNQSEPSASPINR